MNRTVELDLGDIVYGIHGNNMKHPLLVIEKDSFGFKALQVTSIKYNKSGKIVVNKFQREIIDQVSYVQVDCSDGFRFHSLVICNSYYFYEWGKNYYQVKKVGKISNIKKWNEIINLFNYLAENN